MQSRPPASVGINRIGSQRSFTKIVHGSITFIFRYQFKEIIQKNITSSDLLHFSEHQNLPTNRIFVKRGQMKSVQIYGALRLNVYSDCLSTSHFDTPVTSTSHFETNQSFRNVTSTRICPFDTSA